MSFPRLRLSLGLGVSFALVTLAVAACSSDEPPLSTTGADAASTPDGGGTTPETGASDTSTGTDTSTAADTGGACNAVVNGASVVGETAGVGAKPAPAGGTVADGTYYLTKHDVFPPGNPDNNTRKRTWVFAGNTFRTHDNDTGQTEKQLTGTYTTSGTNITFTVTCPMSATVTIPYTATATTYDTFSSAGEDIFFHTKQ